MSVAVTVAGMETVEVDDGQNKYPAHVVSFDPKANVAILEVPGLQAAPLEFDTRDTPGDRCSGARLSRRR